VERTGTSIPEEELSLTAEEEEEVTEGYLSVSRYSLATRSSKRAGSVAEILPFPDSEEEEEGEGGGAFFFLS
jgi:hypothetical protein